MPFGSLWLAVVVAAVAVFIVSAILHMVLKYHRADYKQLSDEEAARQGISKSSPTPGLYFIPYCEMAQMKDPAVRKKYEEGPVAFVTVMPNALPNMGKNLSQWFLFCLLVSFVTSYIARHSGLAPGAEAMEVLRLTATVAFVGYGFGYFVDSIWQGIPWSNSLRGLIDAVVYCLVTGAVFVWLWPAA